MFVSWSDLEESQDRIGRDLYEIFGSLLSETLTSVTPLVNCIFVDSIFAADVSNHRLES